MVEEGRSGRMNLNVGGDDGRAGTEEGRDDHSNDGDNKEARDVMMANTTKSKN